jgi:hypothetical protein
MLLMEDKKSKKKNLPAESQKVQIKNNFFSWVKHYNTEFVQFEVNGSQLKTTFKNQSFVFLVKQRKTTRKTSELKSNKFLLQLKPSREYISSLYKSYDGYGYYFEYKNDIYFLGYKNGKAFFRYLKSGNAEEALKMAMGEVLCQR